MKIIKTASLLTFEEVYKRYDKSLIDFLNESIDDFIKFHNEGKNVEKPYLRVHPSYDFNNIKFSLGCFRMASPLLSNVHGISLNICGIMNNGDSKEDYIKNNFDEIKKAVAEKLNKGK